MSELMSAYKAVSSQPPGNAQSLPFAVYHDEQVLSAEVDRVYQNDWIFICTEQELPDAGDYLALDLAGEPIMLIRGRDRKLRAISNVCRHRGTPLLDQGFGKIGKLIICPYHAWSYHDNGRFNRAPLTSDDEVNPQQHHLPRYALESFLGLVFISFSDNPVSLMERYKGIENFTALYSPERFGSATESKCETWQANWKLIMENGTESYHLFKVHKDTLETVTPSKQAYY